MVSANDAVFQRRNKQIQDAIDGQNLKQALNLIEKRTKKGEDTVFLKAWKAHILSLHTDEAHHQRGIAETIELSKQEPPITDLDTIDLLQQTLQRQGGHEETIRSLWEKAAKGRPQDQELQLNWFSYGFDNNGWKTAQKAAMSLQSNFPKNRKYHFWAIFLSYLIAADSESSDTDRKLFGTLAYRMISKAADSVPSNPDELLSVPRAIQTPEELLLLVKIYESQGRHAEIAKLMDSENVGVNSRVVQNDMSFIGVKLDNLQKASMWAEALSYAKTLLSIPKDEAGQKVLDERDDWAVWDKIVVATRNINDSGTTKESLDFIQKFIDFQPKSRNAQLARLDLIHWDFLSGNLKDEELFAACQEYLDRNKTKLYCFADLIKYLAVLNKAFLGRIIEYAKTQVDDKEPKSPSKGVAVINALKLEYCFQLSYDEELVTRQTVERFVGRCLQLYREAGRPEPGSEPSTIESQPSDDLCVLAAMCLIRFNELLADGRENIQEITLIHAASILERLLLDSPHNYHALLLLSRVYLLLGAGSLALKAFSKLAVKQVQYETVAHNIFTRLATIHPHSAPPIEGAEYKDFDPQAAMVQALSFYRNAHRTSERNRANGLNYGSYTNVEGTIELQTRLKDSICRKMWALEARRMQRLVGGDSKNRYDDLVKNYSQLFDQRVFDAFMTCESPGKPAFEKYVSLGPLPKGIWTLSTNLVDRIFGLLRNIAMQKPVDTDIDFLSPEFFTSEEAQLEMTTTEMEGARINLSLLKVVAFMGGSKAVTSEEVESYLAQAEEWLGTKLKDLSLDNNNNNSPILKTTATCLHPGTPSAPSWTYLHEMFTTLESLKAISLIISVSSKKGSKSTKLPKDRVDRLSGLIRQAHESIRANTRILKSRISEPGVLGHLIELVLSGPDGEQGKELRAELEKTLDTSALELFCGSLKESWDEGLDGVMEVSL